MIRCIAAIDSKNGIANDHGIPWQGKLPTDVKYYHEKLRTGTLLMGFGVYKELSKPYPGVMNYVATTDVSAKLRDGFEVVTDAREFLRSARGDVWNLGGALLFASTIDLADELYLTRLNQDFHCTKFFPLFEDKFELASQTDPRSENGITFNFQVWRRKSA